MINESSVLEEVILNLENISEEDIKKAIKGILKEEELGISFVNRKDYFLWLTGNFLRKLDDETYNSEEFLYSNYKGFSQNDIRNIQNIKWISNFFDEIYSKDKNICSKCEKEYVFSFLNKEYYLCEFTGQGIMTIIRKAENDFNVPYIDLDLIFQQKEF